jgi:hypothetical protein
LAGKILTGEFSPFTAMHCSTLLVYAHPVTPRIKYIFHLLLTGLNGFDISFTSNREQFISHPGPKVSYTSNPLSDEVFFRPAGLLFEEGVHPVETDFIDFKGHPAFFRVDSKGTAFTFDPFAASFFLVSRYEEYLPFTKDIHDRFPAEQSIAFRNGFLDRPLVNIWSIHIAELIRGRFPDLPVKPRIFQFQPTVDIDSAYAYRHKGFLRNTGGYLRSLIRLDINEIRERTGVLAGWQHDPFDTYGYLLDLHTTYGLKPDYFILLGDYGRKDKNLSYRNKLFRELIRDLAKTGKTGIHPSYASSDPVKLKIEINRLSSILGRQVTMSRQHFLRLRLPTTYRNLVDLQVSHDFSMGYPSSPGFRAGICDPFTFYDLEREAELPLVIHPFTVMDGTLKDYMDLDPQAALHVIKDLIDRVKAVNGTFIPIWHNESLCDMHRWKGWRHVYEEMIRYAVAQ